MSVLAEVFRAIAELVKAIGELVKSITKFGGGRDGGGSSVAHKPMPSVHPDVTQ